MERDEYLQDVCRKIVDRAAELADKPKAELVDFVADPETAGPKAEIRRWTRGELIRWILEFEFEADYEQ